MSPATISATTLCHCLHINASHADEQACTFRGCRCTRFSPGARTSAHHYRRGQRATPKRVARLEVGDRVLVGYPGRHEYVRAPDGGLVWEDGVPVSRHVDDRVLRPVHRKTGALLGHVTSRRVLAPEGHHRGGFYRAAPVRHVIETDLGELPPMAGVASVLVAEG